MATDRSLPPGLLPTGLEYEPVRVAPHSKMSTLLQFSLKHLATHTSPLLLHPLPPPAPPSAASTSSAALPNPAPAPASTVPPPPTLPAPPHKPNKTSDSALTKLVSIAEIIKRTRAEGLAQAAAGEAAGAGADAKGKGKGKGKGREVEGVHQYTMVGVLEELEGCGLGVGEEEGAGSEEARRESVALEWLSGGGGGTKRPRKKHTPFMLVVLSHEALPELAAWPAFSYQPPSSLPVPTTSQPSKKRALATAASAAPAATSATPAGDGAGAADATGPTGAGAADGAAKKKRKRRGKKKKAGAAGGEGPGEGEGGGEEGGGGVSMEL